MNLEDLYQTRARIEEDAHNLSCAVAEFIKAQEAVLGWLRTRGLIPEEYRLQLSGSDSALRILITFGNDALVPFADVEGAFWTFVRGVMPLALDAEEDLALLPFRSAEFRDDNWDVVILPDVYSREWEFGSLEFWEKEARNEHLRNEQIAGFLRQDRISDTLVGLARLRSN